MADEMGHGISTTGRLMPGSKELEEVSRAGGKTLPASLLLLPGVRESFEMSPQDAANLHWTYASAALVSNDLRIRDNAGEHVLGCSVCMPKLVEFYRLEPGAP